MPRAPKTEHPVRDVRTATGLNQHQFAELVGTSFPTIQKVEAGLLPVSDSLAERIMLATGADPLTVREPYKQARFLNSGAPYGPASWDEWKTANTTRKGGETTLSPVQESSIEKISVHVRALLLAAARKNRLLPALHQFQRFFDETTEFFGIRPEVEAVFSEMGLSEVAKRPAVYRSPQGVFAIVGMEKVKAVRSVPEGSPLARVIAIHNAEQAIKKSAQQASEQHSPKRRDKSRTKRRPRPR